MKALFTVVCILALNIIGTAAFSADKVVVIPLNSKSATGSPERLWGQGRPGTTALLHDNGTFSGGACSATSGVKFALSKHLTSWDGAAAACPKDTWVCSKDEILEEQCSLSIDNDYAFINCDGVPSTLGTVADPPGWVADAGIASLMGEFRSSSGGPYLIQGICYAYRVWCCHD